MVLVENGVFGPLPKTEGFNENGKILILHHPHKNKGSAPQTLKIDKNNENGGRHSGKITVCQKHRFDNPD